MQNTRVMKILAQVVFVQYLRESMLDFWIIREHFVQFFSDFVTDPLKQQIPPTEAIHIAMLSLSG